MFGITAVRSSVPQPHPLPHAVPGLVAHLHGFGVIQVHDGVHAGPVMRDGINRTVLEVAILGLDRLAATVPQLRGTHAFVQAEGEGGV